MKTKCNLLFFLLLATLPVMAGGSDDIRKEKTISKTFNVDPSATFDLSNKYGSVYVTTGDDAVISVKAVVRVSGKNAAAVEKRLDGISIELEGSRSTVLARTQIGGSGGKTRIEINYTVVIPRKGSVRINNQYGPVLLDRILGHTKVNLQYGKLTATALDEASINLQYADNSTIGHLRRGNVTVQYSELKFETADALTCKSDYTHISAGEVGELTLQMNYGGFTAKTLEKVTSSGNYYDLNISNLTKSLTAQGNYCNFRVSNVAAGAGDITLSGNYTNVVLVHDPAYAFDFRFNLGYISYEAHSGLVYRTRYEKNNSSVFSGNYKQGGGNNVTINQNYGSLKIEKK